MLDRLIEFIAPHYCYSCGIAGTQLCDNCKYDITSEPFSQCLVCYKPTIGPNLCKTHAVPYQKAWVVGERRDVLDILIDRYKFGHERAASRELAALLDMVVPELPSDTVVVAVPTISRHIRQRGFDHAALVARHFAKSRALSYQAVLDRSTTSVQFGASKASRLAQAKQAFKLNGSANPEVPYLLIDDVFTTGATMHYAAKELADAGVQNVWVAVVARQPLDQGVHI